MNSHIHQLVVVHHQLVAVHHQLVVVHHQLVAVHHQLVAVHASNGVAFILFDIFVLTVVIFTRYHSYVYVTSSCKSSQIQCCLVNTIVS